MPSHLRPYPLDPADIRSESDPLFEAIWRRYFWAPVSIRRYTITLRKGVCPVARKEILDQIEKYVDPFRIKNGEGFQLKHFDPGDTRGLKLEKAEATDLLRRGTEWLAEDQDMLYAQDRWSLLLVFQAMDAAGKDSTIKHVMSGVNPQGCQVFSFKQPSGGGPRPRLSLALRQVLARERTDWNLQPVLLRGGPRCARARGYPETTEAACRRS